MQRRRYAAGEAVQEYALITCCAFLLNLHCMVCILWVRAWRKPRDPAPTRVCALLCSSGGHALRHVGTPDTSVAAAGGGACRLQRATAACRCGHSRSAASHHRSSLRHQQ